MLERVGVAVALLAMGYLAHRLVRCYLLWRAAQQAEADPLLRQAQQNMPTVLYFTTPNCAPCKYAQRPALAQLQQEMGERFQLIQVDATEDPAAATRWQVQTVPTTFVLDRSGKPTQVNHGVADATKLRQQIQTVA